MQIAAKKSIKTQHGRLHEEKVGFESASTLLVNDGHLLGQWCRVTSNWAYFMFSPSSIFIMDILNFKIR